MTGLTPRRSIRRKALIVLVSLLLANLLLWALACSIFYFYQFAALLNICALAYTFGLRHALDADHISAIDNVTRKLMQDGQKPLLVGFFFSLGHSTIVVVLSILIALTAAGIKNFFPAMQHIGGLIGTSVSAAFLLLIAGINLLVLRSIVQAFKRVKISGAMACSDHDLDAMLAQLGIMGRIFRPVLKVVDRSWKMYFVGFLFGLGFDTATEIGVLGIAAVAATRGLPIWAILLFPLLFTAGMCLVDTADGILMLGAYGWAFVHPVRKLYYNMTITFVSVVIALLVGTIETLGIIGERFELHGRFWDSIASLSNHFGLIGASIVAIFILSWAASIIAYRAMGYQKLEFTLQSVPILPTPSDARRLRPDSLPSSPI